MVPCCMRLLPHLQIVTWNIPDPEPGSRTGRGLLHRLNVFLGAAQVITQEGPKGEKLEPYEEAVIEVPEVHMGGVVDLMGSRKGQMLDMASGSESTNRVTYKIPTRGLLGLRNSILTATKARAPDS